MKKRLIQLATGAFVALTFVIYSLHQRSEGSQAVSQVGTTATVTQTPIASTSSSPTPSSASSTIPSSSPIYKDGSFTGTSADAVYGYIQVRATISGGKLIDVTFLDYPQDRRDSIEINQQAMPMLKQQAISVQSAQVDGVSGATDTSHAFVQSLNDALTQARV
jgi:uncharacterized protein with FMN-binding domain